MKITHLRVFLDIEIVLHISSDTETVYGVNCYHFWSCWSLEYMKFDHCLFRSSYDSKLTKSHLKHHILSEQYLLSYHDKCSCRWSDISDIKLCICIFLIWPRFLVIWTLSFLIDVLDFTMASADEAFTYYNIIRRRMPS